jgi:hypothetical protein
VNNKILQLIIINKSFETIVNYAKRTVLMVKGQMVKGKLPRLDTIQNSSVADPDLGSGAFFIFGSGISGIRIRDEKKS